MIDSMYNEKAIQEIAEAIKQAATSLLALQEKYGVNFTLNANLFEGTKLLYEDFYMNSNISLNGLFNAKSFIDRQIEEINGIFKLIHTDKRVVVTCVDDREQPNYHDKVMMGQFYLVNSIHKSTGDSSLHYQLEKLNSGPMIGYAAWRFRIVFDANQFN